jgi:putative transposase
LNELRNRGVQDILIVAVDGLMGFSEAINAMLPRAEVQLCIVHMVRNSLKFVPYKDRKAVATDLKKIHLSPAEESARVALDEFTARWDTRYPMISRSLRSKWPEIVLFLKFPEVIRKAVYTTNAIESLNYSIRKVTRNRQSFPTTEAAMKLVFMALQNISKKWTMPLRDWSASVSQSAIIYDEWMPS